MITDEFEWLLGVTGVMGVMSSCVCSLSFAAVLVCVYEIFFKMIGVFGYELGMLLLYDESFDGDCDMELFIENEVLLQSMSIDFQQSNGSVLCM